MTEHAGSCLCGQVKYVVTGDPAVVAICHCKHCQKQTASAYSLVAIVPADAVKITGALKTYDDRGDSGQAVHRRFCPDCGSPITTDADAMPGMTIIKAGTFDDTSWLKPTMQVFCESAQAWVELPKGTENHAHMPR